MSDGPYRGLAPFGDSELDSKLFFGRERESAIVSANVRASRLTLLYGETGVGKSSLLSAAVSRTLRAAVPSALVSVHRAWSDDPSAALAGGWAAGRAYLLLDQFEEFFVYHTDPVAIAAFRDELTELLATKPHVNVLISLRDDALARLNVFKTRLPRIFANQVHLEHLTREAATEAILNPVARWNELHGGSVTVEPALVEAVLDQVASATRARVEAPYLQLVMERVWTAEADDGSVVLRRATLDALGGADRIATEHVDGALDRLPGEDKDIAASVLGHLVTPSGTKIAHRPSDLAAYAGVPEAAVARVVARLDRDRIVRSTDNGRYEIFHDVLAEPILAWRGRRQLERERVEAARKQRRLRLVAAASLIALAVVAALAVFAFSERSHANTRAQDAQARELDATALQQLEIDPARSVQLALDAARLRAGPATEDVLRQSLTFDRLQRIMRLGGRVWAVAATADGRHIVSGGDGLARIYDERGRVQTTLRGSGRVTQIALRGTLAAIAWTNGRVDVVDLTRRSHSALQQRGSVDTVAFLPNGSIVTGGSDGKVRVWHDGRVVRTIGGRGRVKLVRPGPRGALAVVGGPFHKVRVRIIEGKQSSVLPERGVSDVAFSPDGKLFATASHDGGTRVYTVRKHKLVRTLRDGKKAVLEVAFSPKGMQLATAGGDGAVRIWDLRTGQRIFFFPDHVESVTSVVWRPDGSVVADASGDHMSRLLEISGREAGSIAASLAGHGDAVTAVAFAHRGDTVVTGSADGTTRIWDGRVQHELELVGRHPAPVATASFDASGRRIVSAGADGTARIWNAVERASIAVIRLGGSVADARWVGDRVVAGSSNGIVAIWSNGSVRRLHAGAGVWAVAGSRDGRLAAIGTADGRTTVWDVASARRVGVVVGHGPTVAVAFDGDGKRVLAATRDVLTVWDVSKRRVVWRAVVEGDVNDAALSGDGRRVASGGRDRRVRLFDVDARTSRVLRGHTAPIRSVEFSPDGRLLVTSGVDARPREWDVDAGRLLHVLIGQFGTIPVSTFSPDGRWIATAAAASAGIWDAGTGRFLPGYYLRGHEGSVTTVAFAPDSRHLVTGGVDGTVRVFDCTVCVPLAGLEELAASRASVH
jgi:WD40 repeat protein